MMRVQGYFLKAAAIATAILWCSAATAATIADVGFEDADTAAPPFFNTTGGNYSETDTDGNVWDCISVYATTADTNSGLKKAGFNLANDELTVDLAGTTHGVGTVSFYWRASSGTANYTTTLQYKIGAGGTWTDINSYVCTGAGAPITYQFVSETVDQTGDVYLRWVMPTRVGGSFYFDDILVTGYTGAASDDPDASFTPPSLGFGAIAKESTKDLSVNVVNSALASNNLSITGVNFGGADPARFSLVTTLPVSGIAPGTSTTLTFRYDPAGAADADHSATATLVCNDPNPPSISFTGATYLDVANLAELWDAISSGTVRLTGTVTVNSPTDGLNTGGARHQLYAQDASGIDGQTGIYIDDPGFQLGVNRAVGDQLSNLIGDPQMYSGSVEFTLSAPATLVGTGAVVTPLLLTGAESLNGVESELVRINTVSITTADVTWTSGASGKSYTLNSAFGPISVIRVEEGSQLVGQTIPVGNFDVIGIVVDYNGTGQIEPRFPADIISPPSEVPDWNLMK